MDCILRPDIRAWFIFSIFAGDKSWVAGVELAAAGEPRVRKPRIWGVALRALTPATPRCDRPFEPCLDRDEESRCKQREGARPHLGAPALGGLAGSFSRVVTNRNISQNVF